MFPLDEETIRILIRIIDRLADQKTLDLPLSDHPLLRLQRLENIQTDQGAGYSLAIGQLRSLDPARYEALMILLVVDRRGRHTGTGIVIAFPVAFQDDVNHVSEVGALLAKGKVWHTNTAIQQSLATYARSWLAELDTAGYF